MNIEVFRNDNFVQTVGIPDDYYQTLSTWKERKVGAWYRPPSSKDIEAMQYLKDILERAIMSEDSKNKLLQDLNLDRSDVYGKSNY